VELWLSVLGNGVDCALIPKRAGRTSGKTGWHNGASFELIGD
jgi:hypothetical protein